MNMVYFHCSDDQHLLMDRKGTVMTFADARNYAERLARSYMMTPNVEDWRNWVVHVTDDFGTDLFELPFAEILGPVH